MPAFGQYLLILAAGLAGGVLLDEIIRRIPVLRWCILGIKKENVEAKKRVSG
jgi:hypothetical protein